MAGTAAAAAAAAAAATAVSAPEITEYEIYSPKIPEALDGFTIAHISDYHCECMPKLVSTIKKLGADIIVSTGDMVNSHGSVERAVNLTRRLNEIAPLYMVNGNHDTDRTEHKKVEDMCIKGGGRFLHNESVRITHNGAEFMLSGIDDPISGNENIVRKRINDSINKISSYDGFHILLFHRANLAEIFERRGFDLILSGHMHGGQIRIPGIGGVISPKKNMSSERIIFPKYTGGKYKIGNTELIVSRGLGNPIPLPRICNAPEIVKVTLREEK